ncbi:hypothetical protein DERP_005124 [Dermatophagoides pteronyssinus]|uniref:Uncharacterized protein n=1 Tax=Dermatophagoides pteronyssinus TaxID=6956 RepID=A0ABQ8JU08_DERPT|nr:hypothetical protein DERP_005124 [Dermatophagoides pteronyssinus]
MSKAICLTILSSSIIICPPISFDLIIIVDDNDDDELALIAFIVTISDLLSARNFINKIRIILIRNKKLTATQIIIGTLTINIVLLLPKPSQQSFSRTDDKNSTDNAQPTTQIVGNIHPIK